MNTKEMTQSAGLLMYREKNGSIEVFLCKPFVLDDKKNVHWGIPKGRIDGQETAMDAAKREFFEETGLRPPEVPVYYLGKITYPSGKKQVSVWTFKFDPPKDFEFKSNMTKVRDHTGRYVLTPEVGEWKWFDLENAQRKIMISQREIIERFMRFMGKNNNSYGEENIDQDSRTGGRKNKLQGIPGIDKTERKTERFLQQNNKKHDNNSDGTGRNI